MQKIKLKLSKYQWTLMKSDIEQILPLTPLSGWELETCVIADLYKRRLDFFTFFKPNKDNKTTLTISITEAFALNMFFSQCSQEYNNHFRIQIEKKLPPCKPLLENS